MPHIWPPARPASAPSGPHSLCFQSGPLLPCHPQSGPCSSTPSPNLAPYPHPPTCRSPPNLAEVAVPPGWDVCFDFCFNLTSQRISTHFNQSGARRHWSWPSWGKVEPEPEPEPELEEIKLWSFPTWSFLGSLGLVLIGLFLSRGGGLLGPYAMMQWVREPPIPSPIEQIYIDLKVLPSATFGCGR